jgi:hypothetical protein
MFGVTQLLAWSGISQGERGERISGGVLIGRGKLTVGYPTLQDRIDHKTFISLWSMSIQTQSKHSNDLIYKLPYGRHTGISKCDVLLQTVHMCLVKERPVFNVAIRWMGEDHVNTTRVCPRGYRPHTTNRTHSIYTIFEARTSNILFNL